MQDMSVSSYMASGLKEKVLFCNKMYTHKNTLC